MRLTIVKDDNTVIIDGYAVQVDCKDIPRYVHAIQWDGSAGEIEFRPDSDGYKMGNIKITDVSPFQHWIDSHARVIAEMEARAKAETEAAARRKSETTGGMHVFEE